MCRWMSYSGNAFPIEDLIFETEYSLIDQSLSAGVGISIQDEKTHGHDKVRNS